MNAIQEICLAVASSFENQRIEEGYAGIIEFTAQINASASTMPASLQEAIQQQLLVLQHYLAAHDDAHVAALFKDELFTLTRQIFHSIN